MTGPLVSIVLTNYNGDKYVKETIDSIFSQTYEAWELIIVDDCSTDGSYQMLKQLEDPRIRIVQTERNGQISAAHNVGNHLAKGKYIACIDNDDAWLPEKLQKQVQYLEEHPEVGACFTLPYIIDSSSNIVKGTAYERLFYVENKPRIEWLHEMLVAGSHLLNSSSLVRRDALEDIGDNNLCLIQLHDYDIWVRMAAKYELYLIQEQLVYYRRFEGSRSLSQVTSTNSYRADFEFSWIIGTMVRDMDPSEFRQVFFREMMDPDAKGEKEILCEKALLLAGNKLHEDCRIFAFELFDRIFRDGEAAELLYQKYHFSQHDVYYMTGNPILYATEARRVFQELSAELQKLKTEHQLLAEKYGTLTENYEKLEKEKQEMENSTSWKVTEPFRKITGALKG